MYLTPSNSLEARFFGVPQILFVDAIVDLSGEFFKFLEKLT